MRPPPLSWTSARRRARQLVVDRLPPRLLLRSGLVQRALGVSAEGELIHDCVGGLTLAYRHDSVIGRALLRDRAFEAPELAFFAALLRRTPAGGTVLDVGANIGLHSLTWAAARPDLPFVAFEPSPRTATLLETNIRANGRSAQIRVLRAAVAATDGTAEFFECDDDAFSSLKDTGRRMVRERVQVPTIALDTYVRREAITQISLLKIDVEGLEHAVLQGAAHTLGTLGPDLFVEIYGGDGSNPDPAGTVAYVQSLGYQAHVLVDGVPLPYERHDDRRYNYYFTRARRPC